MTFPSDTPPPPPRLGDLPPVLAHRCLGVARFVAGTLDVDWTGTRLVVACSGGPDSLALLAILQCLAPRHGLGLTVAHLDHALRPESREDAHAVRQLCAAWDLPFRESRQDVAALALHRRTGLEDAGRQARREFLERLRRETDAAWIVTGHQLNDLAEDQILRRLRGAGWPALGGMAGADASRQLLRPLLLTPRAHLLELLQALRLPWRLDPSNDDRRFLRNRVRHDILPLLLQENPAYLDAVAGQWRLARIDAARDEAEVAAVLAQIAPSPAGPVLPWELLGSLPPALRLRCCKRLVELAGPGQPLLETLLALEQALASGVREGAFQFPGGKTLRLDRQGLRALRD